MKQVDQAPLKLYNYNVLFSLEMGIAAFRKPRRISITVPENVYN
jgi:hypothetical protein